MVPLDEASSHGNHAYSFTLTRNNERSMAGTGKIGQMTWVRRRKRVLEVFGKGEKGGGGGEGKVLHQVVIIRDFFSETLSLLDT